jgi:CelD/BcsL family acetyltransferase involved in cellulose biosynthesis
VSTYRFDVLAASELAPHRHAWRVWGDRPGVSPFASPAFFDAWCRAFGDERPASVVIGQRGRELALVLPLWHLAGVPRRWESLGAFRADYPEPVIAEDAAELGRTFWQWAEREAPCQFIRLARVPRDSLLGRTVPDATFERRGRTLRAARNLVRARALRYLYSDTLREHPYADRAAIRQHAAKHPAANSRQRIRMLAKMAGGEVSYTRLYGRDVADALPAFFAMHVTTFAGTGRASQFESARDRVFFEHLVGHPEHARALHMDVLTAAGKPAAMHLGFEQGGVLYYYKPTFELTLAKASPGKILLSHMFVRAEADGLDRVDLLKGTEAYKAEWASETRTTITSRLVWPSVGEAVRAAVRRWRA